MLLNNFIGNIKIDSIIPCILKINSNDNSNKHLSSTCATSSIETIIVDNSNESRLKQSINMQHESLAKDLDDENSSAEVPTTPNDDVVSLAGSRGSGSGSGIHKITPSSPPHVTTTTVATSSNLFQSSFSSSANLKLV